MEVVTPRPQLTIRIQENKHNPVGRGNHTKTRDVPGTRGQPIVHPTPPEGTERNKETKTIEFHSIGKKHRIPIIPTRQMTMLGGDYEKDGELTIRCTEQGACRPMPSDHHSHMSCVHLMMT